MDNEQFNIIGQKGQETEIDILATFLPGLEPCITVEGKSVSLDEPINEGMKVFLENKKSLRNILQDCGLVNESEAVWLNGKEICLLEVAHLHRNGEKAGPDDIAAPGDDIYFQKPEKHTVSDFVTHSSGEVCGVFVNEDKISMTEPQIWVNKERADLATIIKPGDRIELKRHKQTSRPILVDIFNKIDFSPQPPTKNSRLVLLLNGSETEYTRQLKNGDKIKIHWI